ncbi:MAG: hypothetical protein IPI04_16210 [Ignavibacteria bacterium]|nr:hypothetical protein [Ignavibacteria bacterium]
MKKFTLVTENNWLLRDGIVTMINEQEDLGLLLSENSGKYILKSQNKPDIVLIDLGLQGKIVCW